MPSPSTASTPTRVFFRRSTHFLGFSRSKIAKTLPGRDATSVLCPFSFQPCVGAYVGRAHTYAHIGAVACMRSRSPSATSYLSVCRGGGSQLRFFLLRQTSRHFFHKLPSPSTAPTPTRVFFRRSTHFLGFLRKKYPTPMSERDATCLSSLFLSISCVQDVLSY